MDLQALDALEAKVVRLVQQLDHLKGENRELRLRVQELQAVLEDKERVLYGLKVEAERAREAQSELEHHRKNQDRIRSKVETLLQKLKEFEDAP
jgi:chromosome segregation ATPase